MSVTFVKPYLAEGQIEIPVSRYLPIYNENLKALRRSVQMPGFRPGHIPIEYVRSRYGKDTLEKIIISEFFAQIESLLGESRMIGLPFYTQEPENLAAEPPYVDYHYRFQVLVRPTEPLRFQGTVPPLYTHETSPTDLELFQRYVRMHLGEKETISQLPPEIPPDTELYVKLHLLITSEETVSLSWVSMIEPFPYGYIAGRAIAEEINLPPSHLMPYVEAIRSVVPNFSPLAVDKLILRVRSAYLVTPANDEKIKDSLNLSDPLTEDVWHALLARETHRILTKLNDQTYENHLLYAADIKVPLRLAQINYLFYLRKTQNDSRSFMEYEDYIRMLGWRVFMESHIGHIPDLEVSDEAVETEVWDQLQTRMEALEEGKAFLAEVAEAEGKRQAIIQDLIGNNKEGLRRSMQYKRFENWLTATYGPRPEKPIPLHTILLGGL